MITKIKRIDNLRQLKVLDLRGNHITEVGRFLSNVPSSLKEIKVRKKLFKQGCNKITNLTDLVKLDTQL